MKRSLNLLLLISSFFGYLEWGKGQHRFVFQMEYEILFTINKSIENFTHPLIILPLLGQLILIITIFQKKPSAKLTYIGMAGMGLLYLLIFLVGILGKNISILGSSLPFLCISLIIIVYQRRQHKINSNAIDQGPTHP